MTLPLSQIARRLQAPEANVWQVHEDALERKRAGDDILLLSVGDPDLSTPDYIADYTVAQIRLGRTHYSPAAGEPELRRCLAELENSISPRAFTAEQFAIFSGATAALYATFSCLLDPGDEVVIPEPMYAAYRGLFAAIGAKIVGVPLLSTHDGNEFVLDPEAVIAAIGPATRAVLVNTPGNPCGNIIPSKTLETLAAYCRKADIWFVCDEVYSLITFDGPHISALRAAQDLSNVVVIDGLSKSHAMSRWRVGWAAAPVELVEELARFGKACQFCCCQFIQDGAAYALRRDPPDVELMRLEYQRRRDFAMAKLDAIPALGYSRPRGGMFIMVDVSRVANDGDEFARRLLDEAGISTVPGRGFGPSAQTYIRVSLTQPAEILGPAFDRMATVASRS
ncbi:MAG: pyridoxal phosphate-dependent aminotransferase [Pseudomonadales bacterium]